MRQFFKAFQGEILAVPARVIAVVFGILLFVIPIFTSDPYVLHVLIMCNIYAIFAASWDLLAGYVGQLTLGQSAFFGIGAYASALLNLNLGWHPVITIIMGTAIAVIAGLIIGVPALRLRGPYLAIVSVAFPFILISIVRSTHDFTGGYIGLTGITPLLGSRMAFYYASLILMSVCIAVMWKLTDLKSNVIRTGLLFRAVREDEISARASGINTVNYKFLAYAISGLFAGLAGAFYVHYIKNVGTSSLELHMALNAIIWTVVGGMGTIHGAVTGVYLLVPLEYFLMPLAPWLKEIEKIVIYLLGVLVLLFMPEGINAKILDKIQITCPRCKIINAMVRKKCRVCDAPLHGELITTQG